MPGFKKIFLTMSFIAMSVSLGGCDTMDTAMYNVRERISSIDLKTPKAAPANKASENREKNKEGSHWDDTDKALIEKAETETEIETATEIIDSKEDIALLAHNKTCPPVSIIKELNVLHEFTNPDRPTPSEKISEIALTDLRTGCKYNKNNVAVEIKMTLEGKLGPRARVWATDQPNFAYPYFIAITTPNGNIIAKEVFAATISYDKGKQTTLKEESLRQIIPINGAYGGELAILIGFQLTEGELAYNRALKNRQRRQGENAVLPVSAPVKKTGAGTKKHAAKPLSIIPPRKPQNRSLEKAPVIKAQTAIDDAHEAALLKEIIAEETSPLEKTPTDSAEHSAEHSAEPVVPDMTAVD